MKDFGMGRVYNQRMVLEVLVAALADAPRGTKAKLGRDTHTTAANVTKWAKGWTCPTPDKWPTIEDSLEMQRGTLELAAYGPDPVVEQLADLFAEMRAAIAARRWVDDRVLVGLIPSHPPSHQTCPMVAETGLTPIRKARNH